MTVSDERVDEATRALLEISRRLAAAAEADDGEPYSDELMSLAKRMAEGDRGVGVQRELTVIIRRKSSTRDVVEACALLGSIQDERIGVPTSLARVYRAQLVAAGMLGE